jgi:hypothetical protein
MLHTQLRDLFPDPVDIDGIASNDLTDDRDQAVIFQKAWVDHIFVPVDRDEPPLGLSVST